MVSLGAGRMVLMVMQRMIRGYQRYSGRSIACSMLPFFGASKRPIIGAVMAESTISGRPCIRSFSAAAPVRAWGLPQASLPQVRRLCSSAYSGGEACSQSELQQLFAPQQLPTKEITAALRGRLNSKNIVTLLELCGMRNIHPKYFISDAQLKQLALTNPSCQYSDAELVKMMRVLRPLKFSRPQGTVELICSIVMHHLSSKQTLSLPAWCNLMYSMQHVDCSAACSRPLTERLLHILEEMPAHQTLNSVGCAKAIYGLQQTTSRDALIRRLLRQIHQRAHHRVRLDQKGVSMALYGVQNMSNAVPEVQAILDMVYDNIVLLPTMSTTSLNLSFAGLGKMISGERHFERVSTALTGYLMAHREPMNVNSICNILYSMRNKKPQHHSTQILLSALANKTQQAVGSVTLSNCAKGIYGVQSANFTSRPVRTILAKLGGELQQQQFRLTSDEQLQVNQLLAYVGYGLQRMHTDIPEVQLILEQVKAIVPWDGAALSPKAASTFLYGLRHQPLNVVSELLDNMITGTASEPSTWRPNQLGCAYYALRRFPPSNSSVAAVRAVLRDKLLAASVMEFNDVTLANILASFRLCRTLSDVDQSVLRFVLQQFQKVPELSAFSIIASLYGLAGLRSNEPVVAELQQLLVTRMQSVAWELDDLRHVVSLAEFMGLERPAAQNLLVAFAQILRDQPSSQKMRDVMRCLALLKPHTVEVGAPYVRDVFDAMLAVSESNQLPIETSGQLAAWCSALFCLADNDPRIAQFLKLLTGQSKWSGNDLRPGDLPNIILGLSKVTADPLGGEALFLRLTEMIDNSDAAFLPHHISSICYNLHHIRLTSVAAQNLMSALATKIRGADATLDVNNMARCMFGLQHLNSGLLVSEELTQAVSAKAASNNPEFWRQVVEVVQGGVAEQQGSQGTLAEFEEDNDELEEYLLQHEQDLNS